MNCLYCGRPIDGSASDEEKNAGWHSKCIRDFFGTEVMPDICVSNKDLEKMAMSAVSKGLTVPGVQKKLSLHLSTEKKARLTIVDYPTGYILKPQTKEFEYLPEAEKMCMDMAEATGIKTVPNGLIRIGQDDEGCAYITKRIDRTIEDGSRDQNTKMFAMEDFCQLSERPTQDKYKGSYEKCAGIIKKYDINRGLSLSELFLRIVFSFVTGDSDMHLKNFSLIEASPGGREFSLSAAYDMIPVNIVMPEDDEELALTLNGKKKRIKKEDFFKFADKCSMPEKAADKILGKVVSLKKTYMEICDRSYISGEMKKAMKELIDCRINVIS